jgi:lipopolysaccharide transport system ATP-binding protein
MTIGAGLRTDIPYIIHGFEHDVVAFQVIDSMEGDTARGEYAGKMRGVVRPFLKWTTDYDSEMQSFSSTSKQVTYGSR